MSVKSGLRLAIVAIHPAPYREHILNTLNFQCKIKAFYAPHPLPWGFWKIQYPHHVFVNGASKWTRKIFTLEHFNSELYAQLRSFHPDVLLCYGYERWPMLGAMLWAFEEGIPVLVRHDGNVLGEVTSSQRLRRRVWGAYMLRHKCAGLAIGTSNERYWVQHLGFPKERIFWVPYTVDTRPFDEEGFRAEDLRREFRCRWNFQTKKIYLSVGRMVPDKNMNLLLKAFDALHSRRPDVALVLVGEGPEKNKLLSVVSNRRILSVHFAGYVPPSALPGYYAAADIFVLPSRREHWGLVMNEAMTAGLPVVASDRVGAAVDLLQPGYNGELFRSGDSTDLERAMEAVLDADLASYGARSKEIVKRFNPDEEMRGFFNALEAVRRGHV